MEYDLAVMKDEILVICDRIDGVGGCYTMEISQKKDKYIIS